MKWFSTLSVLPLTVGWAPPAVSHVRNKEHKPDDLVSASIADGFLLRFFLPPPPPLAVAGGFYLSFALLVRPISCIAYDNGHRRLRSHRRRGSSGGGGVAVPSCPCRWPASSALHLLPLQIAVLVRLDLSPARAPPRRRHGRGESGGGGGGADLGGAGADRQRAAAGACPRGGAAARPPHRPSLDGKLVQEVYIFEA
uniref:Uncharacterized protein n=1 Tax=Oryza glumipatula TaxID=40148 RepID=A0A0D9Z072_9ORYZ